MMMSENEILTSIRTAANPWEQVQVVADLNAMSRKEMEKYLVSVGFELPTRTNRRGRKPGTTVKKAADTNVEAVKVAKAVKKAVEKATEEDVKKVFKDASIKLEAYNAFNHPAHYTAGNIECIQAIEAALSQYIDPVDACFIGQVIKYVWRAPLKGHYLEDFQKAAFYLDLVVRRNTHE